MSKSSLLRLQHRCCACSIAAALATALRHSARKMITVDKEVQTVEFVHMSDDEEHFVVEFAPPAAHAAPAPVTENVAPSPVTEHLTPAMHAPVV